MEVVRRGQLVYFALRNHRVTAERNPELLIPPGTLALDIERTLLFNGGGAGLNITWLVIASKRVVLKNTHQSHVQHIDGPIH